VPFYTSVEKNLLENTTTSAVTPGVGAYDAALALDALQTKRAESQANTFGFASGTARLHVDKTRIANPGPGAYPEGNAWLRKSHNYSAPAPKQRIVFTKGPAAPSIPASHQSYGYEEGSSGMLVMQKSPDPIHTGVGRDTVGPGSYNPPPEVKGTKGAVAWGISKTKKGLIIKNDIPGPGSYDMQKTPSRAQTNAIVVNVNGVEVQFGGASGSSNFASKVPLAAHKNPASHEVTPGPGQYIADQGLASKAKPLPKEHQSFGSTVRRSVDPMKSLSAPTYFRNPGPGAYDDVRRSIGGPNKAFYSDPLPFGATSTRFNKNENGIPGPGDYKPDYAISMIKAAVDKASISKGGVFGTCASRFDGSKLQEERAPPGPGRYDPKPEPPKPQPKGETSVFNSKTSRFRAHTAPPAAVDMVDYDGGPEPPRGDPTRLGPGAYQMADPWSKKGKQQGYRSVAFGSESKRLPAALTGNGKTPGPGRYNNAVDIDQVYKPFSAPPKEMVFGSQTSRFKGPANYVPGPGHYTGHGDLVKKSHNITYAMSEQVVG